MAGQDPDVKIEKFEEYFGDVESIQDKISLCEVCGAKLVFSHLPDYKHLLIQENARCPECGQGTKKTLHVLN